MVKRAALFLVWILCCSFPATAQQLSAGQFGDDFTRANQWLQSNTAAWEEMAREGYDTRLAKAIVFPELLRYNRLRDKIELFGLQVLYIQFGKDYADFSIGPFQMKPSFAAMLEKSNAAAETNTTRKNRIDQLNSIGGQFIFLRMFMQWMDHTYANRRWQSAEEKLRFYATAYNCGYNQPEQYITTMLSRKYFRLTEVSAQTFNYATISALYYEVAKTPANNQFVYLYGINPYTP